MDKYGEWITLKEEVKNCRGCELSCSERVLDYGDRKARIMIVGDRPTANDAEKGRPFSGKMGEYIEETLMLLDIDPKNVYYTNLVNCAPPNYQRVKMADVESCIKCLRKQFLLVRPEIVVCLGSLACKTLIDKDFSLSSNHGKPITKGKVMFLGTYHPSVFSYDTQKRDIFLSDMAELKNFCIRYPSYSK